MASAPAPASGTDRDKILGIQEWLGNQDLAICVIEDHGYDANPRFIYREINEQSAAELMEQYRAYRRGDK